MITFKSLPNYRIFLKWQISLDTGSTKFLLSIQASTTPGYQRVEVFQEFCLHNSNIEFGHLGVPQSELI